MINPIRHSTLHQLKIFEALSRHESVTRTAEELNLTPPAVSIQVKQLAESVGMPLTEQIGKRLYLTEAGRILAVASREVLERLEAAGQALSELQGVQRGSLKLGILTTTKYLIPRLLADFCERHPGIDVSLQVGNRSTLLQRLNDNMDDIYVFGKPPEKLNVTTIPFATNPLIAVAHPGHALAGQQGVSPAQLAQEPFITREQGSGTRLAYEDFFHERGLTLQVRLESASNEAIKQMVAGRMGVSILSEHCVRGELASGELIRLDVIGLPLERQWFLVYPKGKSPSPASQAFLDFLVNHPETAA